jgi:hypothetical protein
MPDDSYADRDPIRNARQLYRAAAAQAVGHTRFVAALAISAGSYAATEAANAAAIG